MFYSKDRSFYLNFIVRVRGDRNKKKKKKEKIERRVKKEKKQ